MKKRSKWLLMGDIHADVGPIAYFYYHNKERLQLDDPNLTTRIILLGDVGANNFGDRSTNCLETQSMAFKTALSKLPFTYICLRGNHEARVSQMMKRTPDAWETKEKYGGAIYVEKTFPKIEYLEDVPAIYYFNGYKTLSLPGAYSVDKEYRLKHGWPWYQEEQLSEEEMDLGRTLAREDPFDLVISHTCPITYEPRDLFLPGIDQTRIDKTMERFLAEIEMQLAYKRWAWGHFHSDRLWPFEGNKEKVMLYNNVVDLDKLMNMSGNDYWDDILA